MPERSGTRCRLVDDAGTSMVEFAMVLPLLTVFLFATVEFGIYFLRYQVLHDAVREAARTAAMFQRDCSASAVESAAEGDVVARATAQGIPLTSAQVSVDGACTSGDYVTVSVDRDQDFLVLGALSAVFPSAVSMDVSSVARNQNF